MEDISKNDVDGLQKEFDCFVKRTIKYVIDHVLEKYVNSLKKLDRVQVVEDPGTLYADTSYMMPELEKVCFHDEKILESISMLGKRHKLVIELGFLQELQDDEIANIMKLSEKTVRNYRCEALKILKDHLEEPRHEER